MNGMTQGELHAILEMLEGHGLAEGHRPRLIYLGVLGASDLALVVDGVAAIARGTELVVYARSPAAAATVRGMFARLEVAHSTRREVVDRLCRQLGELRVFQDRAAELEHAHRPTKPSTIGSMLGDCGSTIDLADCGCELVGAVADVGCDVGCL